jgi:site-specific DNA-methyltransferase (adenine-specific)
METLMNISNNIFQEQILENATLFKGNNIDALRVLPDNSIDSVVTDPPYGISYLNNTWDIQVPTVEFWKEVFRVLKPGGHVLSFSSARTYHRMTVNIELAGFEIRDQIMWIYGQGMPKSQNVGKNVDKIQGNERTVVEVKKVYKLELHSDSKRTKVDYEVTKGESEWEGWGTGLKPAHEPICVGRKPITANTIAQNVLNHRTGAINISECMVASENGKDRHPSNVMFDESGMPSLIDQNPIAEKFFYISKPSVREKALGFTDGRNSHPTVKPVSLMAYLCKLVTPKNGVVLDPFMGSGTTGVSALCCGFNFIGMELGEDYYGISKTRISSFELFLEFIVPKSSVLPKVASVKKPKKKKLQSIGVTVGNTGIWGNLKMVKVA